MTHRPDFEGKCRTTAMGIMPHRDVGRALELALGLDIPFWPQLPNVSYYEDMYAQASEFFPGIVVDVENKKISFDSSRFETDLIAYSEIIENPEKFRLSREYTAVYHRFLEEDLSGYPAIRGQYIGPVSFGFKVMDENNMPIIYNEQVRALLFDFLQRKISAQYLELKEKNPNAFVWLDEPGLGWVFSGLSGFDDIKAKISYGDFMEGLPGPGALHLCANVNLQYLLELGIDILSFDAYQMELMPAAYAGAVAEFINGGGIISWGIVPTDASTMERETPGSLAGRISDYWRVVAENSSIPVKEIARHALIAPARCCLKNIGAVGACNEDLGINKRDESALSVEEQIVEKAFGWLGEISGLLKDKYEL